MPADRYYGVAEQTLKRIGQGLGAETPELTNPDSRGLDAICVRRNHSRINCVPAPCRLSSVRC